MLGSVSVDGNELSGVAALVGGDGPYEGGEVRWSPLASDRKV